MKKSASRCEVDRINLCRRKVKSPLAAAGRELGIPYRAGSNNKAYQLFHDWTLETPRQAADRIQELINSKKE